MTTQRVVAWNAAGLFPAMLCPSYILHLKSPCACSATNFYFHEKKNEKIEDASCGAAACKVGESLIYPRHSIQTGARVVEK